MAKTKYGLIGKNIQYSKSKKIHETINPNIHYDLLDVDFNQIPSLLLDNDYQGFNVTIPYKETIIPFLTEIDDLAQQIGAVNTISKKDNKLIGHNTDYFGFLETLKTFNHTFNHALILGSGGASKAVQAVLKNQNIKYDIASRNKQGPHYLSYAEIKKPDTKFDLIINTTPLGDLNHLGQSPIDLNDFLKVKGVIDLIYNPQTTNLLKQAISRDIEYQNGELMLLSQAKKAHEFW